MTERIKFSKEVRENVYKRFEGRCAYCGKTISQPRFMQIDHIKPIRKGGGNEIQNLFPSCRTCNHYKSSLTLSDFRLQLSLIPERLKKSQDQTIKLAFDHGLIHSEDNTVPIFYFEREDPNFYRKSPADLCTEFEKDMLEGDLRTQSKNLRQLFSATLWDWISLGTSSGIGEIVLDEPIIEHGGWGIPVGSAHGLALDLSKILSSQFTCRYRGNNTLLVNFPMLEKLIRKHKEMTNG